MEIHVASFMSLVAVAFVMATLCSGLEEDKMHLSRSRRDATECEYDQEAYDIVTNMLRVANETNALPGGAVDEIWNKFSDFLDKNCVSAISSIKTGVTNVVSYCQEGDFALMDAALDRLWSEINVFRARINSEVSTWNFEEEIIGYKARMQKMRERRHAQIEKGIALAVEEIVPHLKVSNVQKAEEEFNLLGEYENDVVKQTVTKSIAVGVDLSLLVAFATRINSFPASFFAMELVFPEMEERNLTKEYGVFSIYCQLQKIMSHETFNVVSDSMKNRHFVLLQKSLPYVDTLMDSLVANVAAGDFDRPMQARAATAKAHLKDWYLAELAKRFMENNGADFQKIHEFVKSTKSLDDECHVLFALWHSLKLVERGEGFDALMVWLSATYNKRHMEYDNLQESAKVNHSEASLTKCLQIANTRAPTYKHQLMRMYRGNMECGDTDVFESMHQAFPGPMRVLLSDFFKKLTPKQVQSQNFKDLVQSAQALPSADDKCWAAEAMQETLQRYQSQKTKAYSLQQEFLLEAKNRTTNEFERHICNSLETRSFRILEGSTSNCKLLNRMFAEPFYMATFWNNNLLYTWTEGYTHDDQYWNIQFQGTTYDEVVLQNNYYEKELYFYVDDTKRYPYGSRNGVKIRLHKVDDFHFLLETVYGNRFLNHETTPREDVGARRPTYMESVSLEVAMEQHKFHWSIKC